MRQLIGALPIPKDERILRGFENAEDAAVYQISEERALVVTVDVITPLVDDPETFGAIAAANSVSDVFAMGGRGLLSLSFLSVTSEVPPEVTAAIVRGGAALAMGAGAPVLGGHSVEGRDVLFGLAVVGEVDPRRMFTNDALVAGDQIILTKPLGTGTLTTACKRKGLTEEDIRDAIDGMALSNGGAVDILHGASVCGATDVTGFGLLGHAAEMVAGSGARMVIEQSSVPEYQNARRWLSDGVVTRANARNLDYVQSLGPLVGEPEPLLLDPQTSGGLLFGVSESRVDETLAQLHAAGYAGSARIGEVIAGSGLEVIS